MHRAEINVTPMIDVLLVLMMVFMLAQLRARVHMNVMVPAPIPEGPAGPSGDAIVLEIGPDGSYVLNGTAVARGALGLRLEEVYRDRPRSVLFVRTAPMRAYREVVEAMDVAKGAGVKVLSFYSPPGG